MKQPQIHMKGFVVSERCRIYSYEVIDQSGDTRQFTVEVLLESFTMSPLKFQDGPLISCERISQALAGETPAEPANATLTVSEPDIRVFLERHYPPKVRVQNHFKPPVEVTE